jgi:hypothetical protein
VSISESSDSSEWPSIDIIRSANPRIGWVEVGRTSIIRQSNLAITGLLEMTAAGTDRQASRCYRAEQSAEQGRAEHSTAQSRGGVHFLADHFESVVNDLFRTLDHINVRELLERYEDIRGIEA